MNVKRFLALTLLLIMLINCTPVAAIAAAKQMNTGVPEWNEETVRQYALDYVEGKSMDRLWGYYVSAILTQAPILYNYACVEALGRNVSLYKTPIDIYKWNMTNLFPYELLGDSWRFGPLLYTLLFSVIFTIFVFSHQKRHWIKPQHFAKCYK